MEITSLFFEFALIFVTLGIFYLFGYLIGYNRGIKEGITTTLNTCIAMKDVIIELAFGESRDEQETETK